MRLSLFALLVAFVAATQAARAADAVPMLVGYNGRLLDATDTPVSRTGVALKVGLYDTDNPSKPPIWQEARTVDVAHGYLSLLLGEQTPLDASVFSKPEVYVSLTLDGTELLPRQRFASLPYALRAATAALADKVGANGVDTAAIADDAVTLAKLAPALRNDDGKLDADTLDGFDSSAFAPADLTEKIGTPPDGSSIAGEIGAIRTTLATLGTGSTGIATEAAAGTAAATATKDALGTIPGSTVAAKVSAIGTQLGTVAEDATFLRTHTGTIEGLLGTPTTGSSIGGDLALLRSGFGTAPTGRSIWATLGAQRRHSMTCKPATDPWLRDAYPGLSDADLTAACLRDGRWHFIGTALDFIMNTGNAFPGGRLPQEFQYGVSNYAGVINEATVNSWNWGARFCYGPTAVGDALQVSGSAFVSQCVSLRQDEATPANRVFVLTHKLRDVGGDTAYGVNRSYGTFAVGDNEAAKTTCTPNSGGSVSCGNSESFASFWRIYVRQ